MVTQKIPVLVIQGFYSGVLAMAWPEYSINHVMKLGKHINRHHFRVVIDGHPSVNGWGGKMPLITHVVQIVK